MAIQFDNSNSGTLTMKPASSGNYSIVWPATAGTTNYLLQTDGSGNLAWAAASGVPTNATLTGVLEQTVAVTAALTGTINISVKSGTYYRYTTTVASPYSWVINVRGDASTTVNSIMAVDTSITITYTAVNGGTPGYMTAIQIDGTAQTPLWFNGSVPSQGNASSTDFYTITIVKTASTPTYVVYASLTRYA